MRIIVFYSLIIFTFINGCSAPKIDETNLIESKKWTHKTKSDSEIQKDFTQCRKSLCRALRLKEFKIIENISDRLSNSSNVSSGGFINGLEITSEQGSFDYLPSVKYNEIEGCLYLNGWDDFPKNINKNNRYRKVYPCE